jgi:hypothetical protein
MPAPDPRRYLAAFGLLAGGLLALAATVNYFVDPFDYFGRNTLGVYISAEREAKLTGLRQHPRDAVLIGTSKAAMIDVSQVTGPAPFYNASLGGATPEEVIGLVQHVAPSAPLIVVALDFFQYSDRAPLQSDPFPRETLSHTFGYLFNLQGLGYAFTTVSASLRGLPPTLRADGSFDSAEWREHNDRADPAALARIFADREADWRAFNFSPARENDLELLRATLDHHGIPYVVFINPLNAEDLRRIRRAGLMPALDQWLARVHHDFPAVVDLADSSYSDPANFFRLDPVHFYPEVGADMLNHAVLPHAPTRS